MFKFVHHVRILVHDADEMVQYMAQTFAMTPVKVQVYESRGMKNAIYQVGETNLEFTEPLDAHSAMGQYLAREGPGVYHIAFGVDGIAEVAKGLAAKGHTLREARRHGPQCRRLSDGHAGPGQRFGISLPSG